MNARADQARISHRAIPRTWSRGDRYLATGIVAMAREMGLIARWQPRKMPIMIITGPKGACFATLRNAYWGTASPVATATLQLLAGQGYTTYEWAPDDYSCGRIRAVLRGLA